MNLSLNKLLIAIVVLAGFGFAILISQNNASTPPLAYDTQELATTTPTTDATSISFMEEAEARREKALAEKEENDLIAKRKLEKENSVECKFWKQQKNEKSAPKVDEKITEFCTL